MPSGPYLTPLPRRSPRKCLSGCLNRRSRAAHRYPYGPKSLSRRIRCQENTATAIGERLVVAAIVVAPPPWPHLSSCHQCNMRKHCAGGGKPCIPVGSTRPLKAVSIATSAVVAAASAAAPGSSEPPLQEAAAFVDRHYRRRLDCRTRRRGEERGGRSLLSVAGPLALGPVQETPLRSTLAVVLRSSLCRTIVRVSQASSLAIRLARYSSRCLRCYRRRCRVSRCMWAAPPPPLSPL